MKLSKNQILLIFAGVVIVVVGFYLVFSNLRRSNVAVTANLEVWGVFDSEKAINDSLIADFVKANPDVAIIYKQKNPLTYEEELVNALASGTGPDIFMVKNTWIPKHGNKLIPLGFDNLPIERVRSLFPKVVESDFVRGDGTYALPLYIDTLTMFYNQDLFDKAGIAEPPATWEELTADLRKLTLFNQRGGIVTAGVAIGGSEKNINKAVDLLYLIMLQNKTPMITGNRADFARGGGEEAVNFYTQFTRSNSSFYTWDPTLHYSIDSFAQGDVGIIFNYGYQLFNIRQKNPFLRIGISPMIQKDYLKPVNYADYWGLGVSRSSSNPSVSWQFILESTTNQDVSTKYLNAAQRLPALRSVISAIPEDTEIGIFTRQALTAVSWPQVDPTENDLIFSDMIDNIVNGRATVKQALNQAETQINSLIIRRQGQ
ncbi:MAG: hypothetical protein COU06_00185 [Candidatus Harrisonbacteria bacterium CG10_big_fil_rev_8_21_14_0_10_38_8]|uniref:Sugar ABC transporter substrate-binding protein n=1 Tax=Candidatus Harrisonbacteria bacterium CG10_big_fil_rev_8_21_14_0_10_38_8 TaxID=1974582 RepID=A0A2M6WKT1_9BACT|nr:MAG: hypothetical protein COU06_00185 [Candidatus Harrisonbacteria bacterium CG10_big_fil_rev_8_21_14_0_10_38_8]